MPQHVIGNVIIKDISEPTIDTTGLASRTGSSSDLSVMRMARLRNSMSGLVTMEV